MNDIRLYEYRSEPPYTNGVKYAGKDLSDYVSFGATFENVIDETLPTYTLALKSTDMPKEYAPLFKFIVQLVDYRTGEDGLPVERVVKQFDTCVRTDTVETVIISDTVTIYNHHLVLSSLALIAQRKKCDNLAVTYELANVSLDYAPSFNPLEDRYRPPVSIDQDLKQYRERLPTHATILGIIQVNWQWHYKIAVRNQFVWRWKSTADQILWRDFFYNQQANQGQTSKQVNLPLPLLVMRDGSGNEVCMRYRVLVQRKRANSETNTWHYVPWNGGTGASIGEGGNEYVCGRTDIDDTAQASRGWNATNMNYGVEVASALHQIRGSNRNTTPYDNWTGANSVSVKMERISRSSFRTYSTADSSRCVMSSVGGLNDFFSNEEGVGNLVYRAAQINDGNNNGSPRNVTFNAEIDWVYNILLYFEEFSNTNPKYNSFPAHTVNFYAIGTNITESTLTGVLRYQLKNVDDKDNGFVNSTNLRMSLEFRAWSADPLPTPYTETGVQYNVHDLVDKAIDTTQDYLVNTADDLVTRTRSFYIDNLASDNGENWKQTARATKVIENFFTDKNLHEIMLDVGGIMHAIPEYKFGTNNNIAISFRRLGIPNLTTDPGNRRLSIFNSRGVDDYINALDSNISNLVQLGGVVEEYIVAKTESNSSLVANENCIIELQKPIQELISFEVVVAPRAIAVSNVTSQIIPKEIYNTLQGYAGTQNIVTGAYKGAKLYYEIGTKKIQGLSYQSPHNDNNNLSRDYAVKHLLNYALKGQQVGNQPHADYWREVMVNDFVFRIRYRTKDTIRNIQTRMDLRKYILSSGVERFPLLLQTLQQGEKYIDSNKYGLNAFGKLIKSGNTTYQENEWCSVYEEVKTAGELYHSHDELLYVSRNTYTIWSDLITSQLEFSKDFNKLSPLVGIPSEPRFYEISEQSQTKRDIVLRDCLVLGTARDKERWDTGTDDIYREFFYLTPQMTSWLQNVIFGGAENVRAFPKYAITVFKNSPASALSQGSFRKAFLHTMSTYASMNSLCFSWEMIDNFAAGISVVDALVENFPSDFVLQNLFQVKEDRAYKALQYQKYCDSMGRSDLIDFAIINDLATYTYYRYVANLVAGGSGYSVGDTLTANGVQVYVNTVTSTPYKYSVGVNNGGSGYSVGDVLNANGVQVQVSAVGQVTAGEETTTGIITAITLLTASGSTNVNGNISATGGTGTGATVSVISSLVTASNPTLPQVRSLPSISTSGGAISNEIASSFVNDLGAERYYASLHPNVSSGKVQRMLDSTRGIILKKDNREHISINYSINMLTDSDRFIISSILFNNNKPSSRLVLMRGEINKMRDGYIDRENIFFEDTVPVSIIYTGVNNCSFGVNIRSRILALGFTEQEINDIQAIGIYNPEDQDDTSTMRRIICGRNVTGLDMTLDTQTINNTPEKDRSKFAFADWYVSVASNDTFKKQ